MLLREATKIQLSANDLRSFRHGHEAQRPARTVNILNTNLRAEAAEFLPFNDATEDMAQAQQSYVSSLPPSSPHGDRYPILMPANRPRNRTTSSQRPRGESSRQSPSPANSGGPSNGGREQRRTPSSTDSRRPSHRVHITPEQLEARVRDRTTSHSLQHNEPGLEALRFEHSPLDQLMLNLRVISDSLKSSRSSSSRNGTPESGISDSSKSQYPTDAYENKPPTAITISRAPSGRLLVNKQHTHAESAGVPGDTVRAAQTPQIVSPVPAPKSSITTAKRRVQVYHDSPLEHEEETPVARARRNRRAQVMSDPTTSPERIEAEAARVQRHTYPQAMADWQPEEAPASSSRHPAAYPPWPLADENDEAAQIERMFNEEQ